MAGSRTRIITVAVLLVAVGAIALAVWLLADPAGTPGPGAERRVRGERRVNGNADPGTATGANGRPDNASANASDNRRGSTSPIDPGNEPGSETAPAADNLPPVDETQRGDVRAEVVDADGSFQVGVTVRLLNGAHEHHATTDGTGFADIRGVPVGQWLAVAEPSAGQGRGIARVTVSADRTASVRITRGPAFALRGTVTDPDGTAIAGAMVTARVGSHELQATTEADGSYAIDSAISVLDAPTITARAPGFAVARREGVHGAEWNPVLHPLTTGRVRLTAPDGSPVPGGDGARIHLLRVGGDPANPADRMHLDLPAGDWQWPDLVDGDWTVVIETPQGHWSGTVTAPRDIGNDLDLPLRPPASLTVLVQSGGVPLANAHVLVIRADLPGVSWRARTNETGRATFASLVPGPIRVVANHADGRPRAEANLELAGTAREPLVIDLD